MSTETIHAELAKRRVYKKLALGERYDHGDPWGSALEEGFSLCDFLTFVLGRRDLVPDGLGYQPAPGGYPDDEGSLILDIIELWPESGLVPEDLGEYLLLVDKFLDACMDEKLDY